MTWPWLTGTAVLLFMFIMAVLSVLPTIAGNWQLMRSAVRWVHRVRSARQHRNESANSAASATTVTTQWAMEEVRRAYGKFPETPTSPFLSSAPRYIKLPGYHHNGGAASTASVMDLDGYMESLTSQAARTTLRWPPTPTFPFSSASSNTAGTAATA